MKKLIVAVFGVLLLVSLVATPALADPGTFVFKNAPKWVGEQDHRAMVTDPLVSTSGGTESGYTRFPCQSKEGFEYSIGVHGLAAHTTYTVRAISRALAFEPGYGLLPTSDGPGIVYPLGTIRTGVDGDGEVSGLVPLAATHPFLPFGLYEWDIQVIDASANVVLQNPIGVPGSPDDDPVGLQVFP